MKSQWRWENFVGENWDFVGAKRRLWRKSYAQYEYWALPENDGSVGEDFLFHSSVITETYLKLSNVRKSFLSFNN